MDTNPLTKVVCFYGFFLQSFSDIFFFFLSSLTFYDPRGLSDTSRSRLYSCSPCISLQSLDFFSTVSLRFYKFPSHTLVDLDNVSIKISLDDLTANFVCFFLTLQQNIIQRWNFVVFHNFKCLRFSIELNAILFYLYFALICWLSNHESF